MGGYGSTRWGWHAKKRTVEECLNLSIVGLRRRVVPAWAFDDRQNHNGSIVWRERGQEVASVSYRLVWQGDAPHLRLSYRERGRVVAPGPIRLQHTIPNYGGVRWWFTCPSCGRRCGKLYKPPGARFACRHCHGLAYTSAQEAHRFDRCTFGHLARVFDLARRYERLQERHARQRRGSARWKHTRRQIAKVRGAWLHASQQARDLTT